MTWTEVQRHRYLQEESQVSHIIAAKHNAPSMKLIKPTKMMCLCHHFPIPSSKKTRAEETMDAWPTPLMNLTREWDLLFRENIKARVAKDRTKQEMKTRFLCPRDESSKEVITSPANKQPKKNKVASKPLINELAHLRPHSDMIVLCTFPFQA